MPDEEMTNVAVMHADTGVITARVVRSEAISPHIQRVTIGGGELDSFDYRGFDQWFRLLVPVTDQVRFDNVPSRFDVDTYQTYLALPDETRPEVRNYTVRDFRRDGLELDIDFVVHGDDGIAGPWSKRAKPGDPIAFIDQGHGWLPEKAALADEVLIVADETAMPAALGVLRSLEPGVRGHAIIEVPDDADRQPAPTNSDVTVEWVTRGATQLPGQAALAAAAARQVSERVYAFAVGESSLATGVRRLLVRDRGIDRNQVTFCGYYKLPA